MEAIRLINNTLVFLGKWVKSKRHDEFAPVAQVTGPDQSNSSMNLIWPIKPFNFRVHGVSSQRFFMESPFENKVYSFGINL